MSKKKGRGALKQLSLAKPGTPERLAIAIPPSPTSSCTVGPSSPCEADEKDAGTSTWTTGSTTPTIQNAHDAPEEALPYLLPAMKENQSKLEINAGTIVSPDILAIAELQASMKQALQGLSKAFDHIEEQAERMNQLALEIKAREQLEKLRNDLEQQIKRQAEELSTLKLTLEAKIKIAVAEHIRSELSDMIKGSVVQVIEDKVRQELSVEIPDHLREIGLGHQRQILEVKTNLHNSEARRYNASLQSASLTVPLRPLLRPVPTPEQSPYPILVTTATDSQPNSPFPLSMYPHAPAPTPIKRSTSLTIPGAISRSQSQSMQLAVPQTPSVSALFPKDLKSLFALGPDDTKSLLREYGLRSTLPSPVVDETKQKDISTSSQAHSPIPPAPPSPVPEESENEEDVESHVEDMNTFMTHIGVPFLMIPPPKAKETNADRRRKLAPLIINTSGLR